MTLDRPQDGLKTFQYLSDAEAWLAAHGMVLHPVSDLRRIYTYANADLSVWVEITMGSSVAVSPIKRPAEVEEADMPQENRDNSLYPDYRVFSDEDGRWYVIDGQEVIHDAPFYSRQSAIDYRDDVALRLETMRTKESA